MQKTVQLVQKGLTLQVLRELNARVDVIAKLRRRLSRALPERGGVHRLARSLM